MIVHLLVMLFSLFFATAPDATVPLRKQRKPAKPPVRAANKRGWTGRGKIRQIMAKYIPATFYGYPNDDSLRHFRWLTAEDLILLSHLVPEPNLSEQQNAAPNFAEFVQVAQRFPTVTFHGYVVDMRRDDERISIEGAYVPQAIKDEVLAMIATFPSAERLGCPGGWPDNTPDEINDHPDRDYDALREAFLSSKDPNKQPPPAPSSLPFVRLWWD